MVAPNCEEFYRYPDQCKCRSDNSQFRNLSRQFKKKPNILRKKIAFFMRNNVPSHSVNKDNEIFE